MIRDFEIINPFKASTEMFTGYLDVNHEAIADYTRRKLADHDSYTSYFDTKFNDRMINSMPMLGDLMAAITSACDMYANMRLMKMEHVRENPPYMWFSEYQEGERHTLHNHPQSLIAGTYYPYADEDSCDIRFRHPASCLLEMAEPWMTQQEKIVHTIYKLQPKTGMINLWPSWMQHEIGPQKKVPKERSRLAISFNCGRLR